MKPFEIPEGEVGSICDFLDSVNMGHITKDMQFESYQQWKLGGYGWGGSRIGGTYILRTLCWYHHIHKPGSKEWRPRIILKALLEASRLDASSGAKGVSE